MVWWGAVDRFQKAGVRVRRTRKSLVFAVSLLIGCGGLSAAFGQEARPLPDPGRAPQVDEADRPQGPAEADAPTTTAVSGAVYLLCAGTSCICAVLLLRGYSRNGVRLLFWSGLCFVGLALDNVMLYVDLVVVPNVNIEIWRRLPGLVALTLLLYGLVWDSK